ncbi:MAG: response regulator [Planctomycetota bacterium]
MKILVVDNDPGMRNLLAMAFRQEGIETHLTESVEEAETFLRSGECGAVLMDFHLGAGASGAQFLAGWSQEITLPPFWLVTGTPEEADVAPLQSVETFQGVISKPFSILDLVTAVRTTAFPVAATEPPPLEADGTADPPNIPPA